MTATKTTKVLNTNTSVYQHSVEGIIAFRIDGVVVGQISNKPHSKNYNEQLFKVYKALLVAEGKWEGE